MKTKQKGIVSLLCLFWYSLFEMKNYRSVSAIVLERSFESEKKYLLVRKPRKSHAWQFPQGGVDEGETLLEADWRIAYSFVEMLKRNLGNRIMLADHSGAIRVFAAIIKTLDFADYSSLKEKHESIIALNYQPGMNIRFDYIQKKEYMLRKR